MITAALALPLILAVVLVLSGIAKLRAPLPPGWRIG